MSKPIINVNPDQSVVLLNQDHPKAVQPRGFVPRFRLYDHQKTELNKAILFEQGAILQSEDNNQKIRIRSNIGILGDKPGYGKTTTIISLILHNRKPTFNRFTRVFERIDDFTIKETLKPTLPNPESKFRPTTLIIVPHVVVAQWQKELDKTDLSYKTYLKKEKLEIMKALILNKPLEIILVGSTQINNLFKDYYSYQKWIQLYLQTHPNISKRSIAFKALVRALKNKQIDNLKELSCSEQFGIHWSRVIIDEPDTIKSSSYLGRGRGVANVFKNLTGRDHKVAANFYWLLTATYRGLKETAFLQTFYHLSNHQVIKSDPDYLSSSFSLPPPKTIRVKCYRSQVLFLIANHAQLPEKIQKMLDSQDVQSAIEALGGTVGTDDDDTKNCNSLLSLIQKRYEGRIEYLNSKIGTVQLNPHLTADNKRTKINKINNKIHKTKMILERFEKAIKDLKEGECCICMNPFEGEGFITNCCQFVICKSCIDDLFQTRVQTSAWTQGERMDKCPYCREPIDLDNLTGMVNSKNYKPSESSDPSDPSEPFEEYAQSESSQQPQIPIDQLEESNDRSKLDAIVEICKDERRRKILIYSKFDTYAVAQKLSEKDIEFDIMKGQLNNRIDKYRNSPTKSILLMDALTCGAGLNLPETTDIILIEELNESITEQIVGRANRMGRCPSLGPVRLWILHF